MQITAPARKPAWYSPSNVGNFLREARRFPLIPLAVIVVVLVIPAFFASFVAPHHPTRGQFSERLTPPAWQEGGSARYLLGTDKQGRDILSRIIHGAKYVLAVSLTVIAISGVIGVGLGLIAGYFGGRSDMLIMRGVDIALSIPAILLALAIVASRGPGFGVVIFVICVILWSRYARQVRGEVLAIKNQDFIGTGQGGGVLRLPHHHTAHLSQRGQLHHRAGDPPGGICDSAGSQPQFPGRRYSPAHARMGPDGSQRTGTGGDRLVGVLLPRRGHLPGSAVPEPDGRLAARPPGPQAAQPLINNTIYE